MTPFQRLAVILFFALFVICPWGQNSAARRVRPETCVQVVLCLNGGDFVVQACVSGCGILYNLCPFTTCLCAQC